MAKTLKQVLRIATLLIGMTTTSVVLAVATVDVTITGPQEKANETTIKLFDSTGSPVPPVVNTRDRFSVEQGAYTVEVYVQGKLKLIDGMPRQKIDLANGNNQLRVDSDTGVATVVPGSASGPAIQPWIALNRVVVLGGGGEKQVTPVTTGVYQADDSAVLGAKGQVPVTRFDVSLQGRGGPLAFRTDFGTMYGNASTSTAVPAGPKFGWAYSMPASNGATGVVGGIGGNANTDTKYDEWYFNGAVEFPLMRDQDMTLYLDPEFRYQNQKTTYNSSIAFSAPGVSSTMNQVDKENDWALGLGLRAQRMLGNGFTAGLGAGLDLMHYSDRYNGTQHNLCNVCAMPVQDFSVSTSDSKSGWTWATWVYAGAGYAVTKDISVDLLARYRYEAKNSSLVQKVAPSDPPPHLDTDSRYNWSLQLGLAWSF